MTESPAVPVARSPITPVPPVAVVGGWTVSTRQSGAPLTLTDLSPLAKVLIRAAWDGAVAGALGVPFGRATRGLPAEPGEGAPDPVLLVTGSGPGEWLVVAPVGTAGETAGRLERLAARVAGSELVTVTDLTHGRALLRLTGDAAPELLAMVCQIDLRDAVTPDGTAFRAPVARVATDVVRDDLPGGTRSYLLHCERSVGQYLFDTLLETGGGLGIDAGGFTDLQPELRNHEEARS